jgi:hypothetical protein
MPAKRAAAAPRAGYSKRPRLDKLGVKPEMRVALVGLDDPAFVRELRGRTKAIETGRPKRGTEMILFAIENDAPLARLTALREAIAPDGAIWMLWPKAQKHITEGMIRDAALRQGLVDIKVMAFSERLSGLKLVIPRAQRGEGRS